MQAHASIRNPSQQRVQQRETATSEDARSDEECQYSLPDRPTSNQPTGSFFRKEKPHHDNDGQTGQARGKNGFVGRQATEIKICSLNIGGAIFQKEEQLHNMMLAHDIKIMCVCVKRRSSTSMKIIRFNWEDTKPSTLQNYQTKSSTDCSFLCRRSFLAQADQIWQQQRAYGWKWLL